MREPAAERKPEGCGVARKWTRRQALGMMAGLGGVAAWEWCEMLPGLAQQSARSGSGTLTYRDPRLTTGLPPREWQLYRARENPNSRVNYGYRLDPKYRREYPHRLQVAALEDTGARRVFVVHYQQPQDELLARQSGHLLARLYWISRDYLGMQPVGDRFTAVFLARGGEAGGEEADGNIYLHAVEEPRAPAEWVRELAHEYGHVVLPLLGEYREPEKWANGYLGERLLMKWLLHDNGATDVWTEPIDGAAYVALQVEPLRKLFCREGAASPRARQRDAAGMDFLIGQVLAVEALYGPMFLRDVLTNLKGTEPEALTPALIAATRSAPRIALHPEAVIPERTERVPDEAAGLRVRRAAYRVFLPTGAWTLELAGEIPEGTSVTLEGTSLAPAPRSEARNATWGPVRVPADGWRLVEVRSPADGTLTIHALALAHAG